jgi:hypothetical protein
VTHFVLYTPTGSLVMVIVASGAVAFVVWFAVKLAVTLPAVALSRLWSAANQRRVAHPPSP